MPVIHLPFRGRANLRNHRKIVVVDNRRAIIGGMNLSGDYMGPTPDPKRWRDLSLVITGPAVADLADLFRSDWSSRPARTPAAPPRTPASPRPRRRSMRRLPRGVAQSDIDGLPVLHSSYC